MVTVLEVYQIRTMNKTRICIYPKDIVRITGKSERYARKLIEKIKIHYIKSENQFVTIDEFCSYTGLPKETVSPLIID
jgi:hypothetical protein